MASEPKADVAGGIAIELGLGLGRDRLLRRLGSGNLVIELFGLDSLILILGHNGANQRLVGRRTLKALDLLVESLTLFGLGLSVGSSRLTELVLGVGRLFVLDGVAVVVFAAGPRHTPPLRAPFLRHDASAPQNRYRTEHRRETRFRPEREQRCP